MPETPVGDILRARREEMRLTLEDCAKATGLRAQVLASIEASDFDHLPHRGHSQGMVSTYARYLGLDHQTLSMQFSDEMIEYSRNAEIRQVAQESQDPDSRMHLPRSQMRTSAPVQTDTFATVGTTGEIPGTEEPEATAKYSRAPHATGAVRVVKRDEEGSPEAQPATSSDASSRSRGSYRYGASIYGRSRGVGASHPADIPAVPTVDADADEHPAPTSTRDLEGSFRLSSVVPPLSEDSAEAADGEGSVDEDAAEDTKKRQYRTRNPRRRGEEDGSSVRERTPSTEGIFRRLINAIVQIFSERQSRLIGIAVILLIVAVIIAAVILIPWNGQGNDVIPVDSDEEVVEPTITTEGTATITMSEGMPLSVNISVVKGETSIIEVITDDNTAYNGTAVGPWSRDFEVTTSLEATFGNPEAVTVTENGTEIPLEKQEDGTGTLTVKVQNSSSSSQNTKKSETTKKNSSSKKNDKDAKKKSE
ncbi:MAG: helix-turn-helix domain-containing protein [Coriobacteriaceae bacterium]|nr:helix-turn-helix domain-containing protein [Coriobacteriaceae bacterium]